MEINKNLTWNQARDLFKDWRDNKYTNQRNSVQLIEIWETVLASKVSKLGDERFNILEQVSIAALDCNRIDVAATCIRSLIKEFPDSVRVLTLVVMKLESQERYDEALEHLETIMKMDETNTAARKRKICILKAKGRTQEAIKEMTEYLTKFMTDQATWQELCDLYLSEGEYSKAAFCMEELILHNPHNHLIHQRYADILYTLGGLEHIEQAASYYLLAAQLNASNTRAYYGLLLCCHQLLASGKTPASKKKELSKRLAWTSRKLKSLYEDKLGESSEELSELLSQLQVS